MSKITKMNKNNKNKTKYTQINKNNKNEQKINAKIQKK